ncbi:MULTISPECIES: DUF397 domain-containing protein [Catenuloplanes]|uniref:DUF397 domain-containing protein n=1 Tax=Catenuloplanes TaxID=33874 RepID=UPI00286D2372|nr:DUF397 domain-containing protein [Catenuloplanes niger]
MDHLTWKKSTRSGPNGGDCVEVAKTRTHVYVRDSKDAVGPILAVTTRSWTRFVREICRAI